MIFLFKSIRHAVRYRLSSDRTADRCCGYSFAGSEGYPLGNTDLDESEADDIDEDESMEDDLDETETEDEEIDESDDEEFGMSM